MIANQLHQWFCDSSTVNVIVIEKISRMHKKLLLA